MLKHLLNIFFPDNCPGCGNSFLQHEKHICMNCLIKLPVTNFHQNPENPLAKSFWGRLNFQAVTAVYFFHKGEVMQRLLHHLKYKGNKEVGVVLGRQMAIQLNNAEGFRNADLIIPVPLHPGKLLQRGYNQSEMIANGISEIWQRPVDTNLLIRKKNTASQTRKSRYRRFENTEQVFHLDDALRYEGKHILLVDDVITTGSTIIACAEQFTSVKGCTISIVAVATPHH
jgi:ComF family protein